MLYGASILSGGITALCVQGNIWTMRDEACLEVTRNGIPVCTLPTCKDIHNDRFVGVGFLSYLIKMLLCNVVKHDIEDGVIWELQRLERELGAGTGQLSTSHENENEQEVLHFYRIPFSDGEWTTRVPARKVSVELWANPTGYIKTVEVGFDMMSRREDVIKVPKGKSVYEYLAGV